MAQAEPMDVDCMDSFDNKENTFHHNVPCTEKGYEELDVSELNMKLRYSMTPTSSPMSKSYTACPESRYDTGDVLHSNSENALTRSLNSTITKNDNIVKSLKSLPLQSLHSEQFVDGNGNPLVLRQKDCGKEDANITVMISGTNDDDNMSLPSSSSSALHTPEATTPTKEIKEASPIIRGLKSVLNMFRSSTSPIPPIDGENITVKQEVLSPDSTLISEKANIQAVASTPIPVHRSKEGNMSKRSSPYKDSIVFNDGLEKELNWKDVKNGSPEKIPIHKLLLQNSKTLESKASDGDFNISNTQNKFHSDVEYMDISNNESIIQDRTLTENYPDNPEASLVAESDSEFVDCESTFSKNESYILNIKSIQEKIALIPNQDETQCISNIMKNTEFADCDSTFSVNESYVLDIKEIQEKISAKTNLDETKEYFGSTQNISTVNDTRDIGLINENITSMSFTDGNLNNDTTMSSDYSDLSKATVDILYELEKLEGNDFSDGETTHEKITEQKHLTDQVDISTVITSNSTFNKSISEEDTNCSSSQLHQFDNTKTNEFETTLTDEKDGAVTPYTVHCNESLNESEIKTLPSQYINSSQDIPDNVCVVKESPSHIINIDIPVETTITHDSNMVENKNNTDMKMISQERTTISDTVCMRSLIESESKILHPDANSIQDIAVAEFEVKEENRSQTNNTDILQETAPLHDSSMIENQNITDMKIMTQTRTVAPDTVQCIEFLTESKIKTSQPQNVTLIQDTSGVGYEFGIENHSQIINTDIPLKTTTINDLNLIESNNFADVKMISQEKTESPLAISDNFALIVKSFDNLHPQNNAMPSEVVNSSLRNDVPSEVSDVMQNDVISDPLEILHVDLPLPEDVREPLATSNVTLNVNETQATELPTTENPSDVPLPDDDDVDKEDVINVISTASEKNITSLPSDINIEMSKLEVLESVPESKHTLLKNNVDNDSNCTLETCNTQASELQTSENICTKLFDFKALETLPESDINICKLKMPNESDLPHDPVLSSPFINSSSSEMVLEKASHSLLKTEVNDNNTITEIVTSSKITIDQNDYLTADNMMMPCDDNLAINESYNSTNGNNMCTVIKDDIAYEQNTSQIEPMDISVNESLHLTHELPDLVNQTIVLADENVQNTVNLNDNTNYIKQVELAASPSGVTNVENFKTEKIEADLNSITDSKVTSVESSLSNAHPIIYPVNLIINDEKHPSSGADNIENASVEMNLSDDQPPKVFTNTPDSELMEVDGTTVDEEIIVSANNSPYVSLMSGVGTVPESIESTEKSYDPKIEDPQKNEEAFEEIENLFVTNNVSSSPPISSKGYNFNFDEIEDPFASKTKIRLSPPLDTSPKSIETDNKEQQFKVPNKTVGIRRKSQPPERKNPSTLKKKLNSSFDEKYAPKTSSNKIDNVTVKEYAKYGNLDELLEHKKVLETQIHEENICEDKTALKEEAENVETKINASKTCLTSLEEKSSTNSVHAVSSDLKTTSSSEQSTYYSAGTSSTESIQSKNVFNLPEIDDVNFNPFATKSKMRQSPSPDAEIDNPFATRSKMCESPPLATEVDNSYATSSKIISSPNASFVNQTQSDTNRTVTLNESKLSNSVKDEDKIEMELMEKDTSANITDTTSSSKATDNPDLTTREVNTEDEDTIEGPFLDIDDDVVKMVNFDNDDMMQFNELRETAQPTEENDGELFIDAEAFEFLLNQNKSNVVADSGKESLFLKFDPLFAKRISSDGLFASLNKAQKRQSTPTKPTRPSLRNEASPIAGTSTLNVTYEGDNNISHESHENFNTTVTKPMMVVTPAPNSAVTPRNKVATPAISNRRSITFTSPAIAVIDRLLSMSANNSGLGHDSTFTTAQSNSEQTEADSALTQLRELLAEKEISVYNLRTESKELKDRLSTMESQVRILESDGQERLKKINELNERLVEKTKLNKSMAAVVEEYERTIASLISDIEQDKKRNADDRIRLINERDEQTAHLSSMEVSFSDLHSKYEKSKQVILTCKANEDAYKKTIEDFQEQITKMQANYEMLKQHATAKLNHANQELDKINRAHEAEVVKLNAMIKRNQLLATSLQETLAQKTKANDELTAICDELINKVGSSK